MVYRLPGRPVDGRRATPQFFSRPHERTFLAVTHGWGAEAERVLEVPRDLRRNGAYKVAISLNGWRGLRLVGVHACFPTIAIPLVPVCENTCAAQPRPQTPDTRLTPSRATKQTALVGRSRSRGARLRLRRRRFLGKAAGCEEGGHARGGGDGIRRRKGGRLCRLSRAIAGRSPRDFRPSMGA